MSAENDIYDNFISTHKDYPQQLAELIAREKTALPPNGEAWNYNLDTMEKDADIGLSANIVVANAHEFQKAFTRYKTENPQMDDIEARARVVFDFLQQNNSSFSYDKNKNDILFGDVTRETFYGAPKQSVFTNATANTNFFDRHIGNIQMICMEPKQANGLPRNVDGLSPEKTARYFAIPPEERLSILYERGFYHEAIHAAMGTTDERKCDVFAMLKVMKEHPDHAQAIFDVYNMQRAKSGYTVKEMHDAQKEGTAKYQRKIKTGAMTYLMPNTYRKLEEYAKHPDRIPQTDSDILKLTCAMTAEPEFSRQQLNSFTNLISQKNITAKDLADNEIIQSCMQQGGFTDINAYIKSDKTLSAFIEKQKYEKNMQKIADLRQKPSLPKVTPPLAPKQEKVSQNANLSILKTMQNNKQHS